MTGADLVTDALRELGVVGAVEVPSGEDAEFCLARANRIIDGWNAQRSAVHADVTSTYTLTPGKSPHTIGPSGDLVVSQRPQVLASAAIVVGNTRYPLTLRDREWWDGLSDHASTGLPSDLYYAADWPDGSLYLYPVPDSGYTLETVSRAVLDALTLGGDFTAAPGYIEALTLTLAESLAAPYHATLSPLLVQQASKARARMFAANIVIPKLTTRDAGMGGQGGGFDYRTGRCL